MKRLWLSAMLLPVAGAVALAQSGSFPRWRGAMTGIADPNGNQFSAQNSLPTGPGLRTLVPLDASTVVTANVAVTALAAGHRTAGGWIYNPSGAVSPLCINEIGTASGTASAGNVTCIPPDRTYQLAPSINAVSVVAASSGQVFSGYGEQ